MRVERRVRKVSCVVYDFDAYDNDNTAATKALKPDEFQEFRLESKKVLSHNVAM